MNIVKDTTLMACCCHQVALKYFYSTKDYVNAIKWNEKAIELRSKYDDGLLWKSYRNLAVSYSILKRHKLASKYLKKAYHTIGNKSPKDSISILKRMAYSYSYLGDTEPAINAAFEATKIQAKASEKNAALIFYSNMLLLSKDSSNAIKSIKYFEETLKYGLANNNRQAIVNSLNNLGVAYEYSGNLNKELQSYKKALNYLAVNDLESRADIINNIGQVYLKEKKHDLSIEELNKSLIILKAFFNEKYHFKYAIPYQNLGDNYTYLAQYDKALAYFQKALIHLTNNFRAENIFENPSAKDTSLFVYSTPDMIEVLYLKAKASYQYYQQNKNPKYLNLANQTYQTLIDFHNKLQQDISTENSRLLQAKIFLEYLEQALGVAYEKQALNDFDAEATFRLMEKNKATVLLQAMNEVDALQFANLPDSLLEQENDLKIAITYYKKQLNEAIEYEDTVEIERLDKIVFEEKQQYSRLIIYLENNYPEYYSLKYQQNQTQLTDVQNTLDDKTALLEYFVGDSAIYILSVQKERSKLYKVNKPKIWEQTFENFRQSLTLKDATQSITLDALFVQSASQIHKWLLKEVLANLSDNITILQIIPDGVLNYIPFGVLLTQQDTSATINYKTLPYLIKEKAIGYSYSAALWLEQQQDELTTKDRITYAGFAPEYGVASGQFKLPFAKQSIKENADLFKGKPFIGNQASRPQFEKSAPQFNVLQLAMHVLLNDEKPMETKLLFSQTKDSLSAELRAATLYNMKLNADIAVLGACNTGSGQLQSGEGVMSLSRAFTYAGASSLVMSLWSIVDQSTATIVNQFFKNLKQGKAKSTALQEAKLHFLDNASLSQTHPRYWAGLIVSGNQQALVNKTNYFWWGLIAIALLTTGFVLMRSIGFNASPQ